jgi:hypothetical protein
MNYGYPYDYGDSLSTDEAHENWSAYSPVILCITMFAVMMHSVPSFADPMDVCFQPQQGANNSPGLAKVFSSVDIRSACAAVVSSGGPVSWNVYGLVIAANVYNK